MNVRRNLLTHGAMLAAGLAGGLYLGLSDTFNKESDYFLEGPATVYDGDTIKIDGYGKTLSVRIFGIDTPELKQSCKKDSEIVPCGEMARQAMLDLTAGKTVSCELHSLSLSRVVGICFADGKDIARTLVEDGWAVEEKHSDGRYTESEAAAKQGKKGLWGMDEFRDPDEWRQYCRGTAHKDKRPEFCHIQP